MLLIQAHAISIFHLGVIKLIVLPFDLSVIYIFPTCFPTSVCHLFSIFKLRVGLIMLIILSFDVSVI